jgi:hypothetical protein
MARWEDTHIINKNFAFGNPAIQYRKGSKARLNGDCAEFAELNDCATLINPRQVFTDNNDSDEE